MKNAHCLSLKLNCLWPILISLFWHYPAFADITDEYTVKAAMTLNVARFTEWPAAILSPDKPYLNLCVLGDNVVQDAFLQMDAKKVSTRSLRVIYLTRLRNVQDCHVLFVSGLDKNMIIQLLAEIKQQPILTVGEQDYFNEYGGMVNLATEAGRVIIQVNLEALKQVNLSISARLLKLATITNPR